jgi:inosose dehydratase
LKQIISRRTFTNSVAATALPTALLAAKKRHIKIGHTGITWQNKDIATAIADVSSEGFYGFETFGEVFDAWEDKPSGLGAVLQAHQLPLISAYCNVNLTDPEKRRGC